MAVGLHAPELIEEVLSEHAELPHLVGYVLAGVDDGPVGAHEHFVLAANAVFGLVDPPAHLHDPAARVRDPRFRRISRRRL